MEEDSITNIKDLSKNYLKKNKKKKPGRAGSGTINVNILMVIATGFKNIPGILTLAHPTETENPSNTSVLDNKKQKSSEQYNKDRVRKYALYLKGTEIFPIPELVAETETKILSYLITDLRKNKLAGIREDTFKDLLKSTCIPCRYFSRRILSTWDVLAALGGFGQEASQE